MWKEKEREWDIEKEKTRWETMISREYNKQEERMKRVKKEGRKMWCREKQKSMRENEM